MYIFGNSSKFEKFPSKIFLSELNKNWQKSILCRIFLLWKLLSKQVGRGWHKTQGQIQCFWRDLQKTYQTTYLFFLVFGRKDQRRLRQNSFFFNFVIKPSRSTFERNLKALTLMLGFAVTNGPALMGIISNESSYYYEEYLSTSYFLNTWALRFSVEP